MRDVLVREGSEDGWLAHGAALELKELRGSYSEVLEDGTAPLEDQPDGVTWHTFAGGAVNRLLAAGLEANCGKRWVAGNLSLRCKDLPMTAARDALRGLPALEWERVAASAARSMARGMVSKFQPCLPEEAEDRLLAERLLDLAGTLRFLGAATIGGIRAIARPPGTRLRDTETNGPLALDLPVVQRPTGTASPRNEIQWIDTPAALRSVLAELVAEEVVGLDVETALDFGTLCVTQRGERRGMERLTRPEAGVVRRRKTERVACLVLERGMRLAGSREEEHPASRRCRPRREGQTSRRARGGS